MGKKALKLCSYLENAPLTTCHTPLIEDWSPYGYAQFWASEYRKFNHMYVRKHAEFRFFFEDPKHFYNILGGAIFC